MFRPQRTERQGQCKRTGPPAPKLHRWCWPACALSAQSLCPEAENATGGQQSHSYSCAAWHNPPTPICLQSKCSGESQRRAIGSQLSTQCTLGKADCVTYWRHFGHRFESAPGRGAPTRAVQRGCSRGALPRRALLLNAYFPLLPVSFWRGTTPCNRPKELAAAGRPGKLAAKCCDCALHMYQGMPHRWHALISLHPHENQLSKPTLHPPASCITVTVLGASSVRYLVKHSNMVILWYSRWLVQGAR